MKISARFKILALAVIFFGPLATAWLWYGAFPGQAPEGRTHHGVLNDPAVPLPPDDLTPAGGSAELPVFDDRWSLLHVAPGNCGDACRDALDTTRQVRALLHRRAARVQRLLVTSGPPPAALGDHPDLAIYRGGLALYRILGEYEPGTVHIVDPLGNWVLTYPAPVDAGGLFKDIKHLLKLSQIG